MPIIYSTHNSQFIMKPIHLHTFDQSCNHHVIADTGQGPNLIFTRVEKVLWNVDGGMVVGARQPAF